MAKSKKLTSTTIKRLLKEQNTKTKISVLDGEYEVVIDDVFEEGKIDKVIFDYLSMFAKVAQIEGEENVDEEFIAGTGPLLGTLILREFSDLRSAIPKGNDPEKIMEMAQVLYGLGRVDENSVGLQIEVLQKMDQNQIARIYKKLEKSSDVVAKFAAEQVAEKTLEFEKREENA